MMGGCCWAMEIGGVGRDGGELEEIGGRVFGAGGDFKSEFEASFSCVGSGSSFSAVGRGTVDGFATAFAAAFCARSSRDFRSASIFDCNVRSLSVIAVDLDGAETAAVVAKDEVVVCAKRGTVAVPCWEVRPTKDTAPS